MSPDDDDRTVIRPPGTPPAHDRTTAVGAPPPAQDLHNGLPIGTHLGEFELTAMVGEGGFGIVYLAIDHSLQRRVALKEYMPSSLAARTGASQVKVKSERHRETFEAGLNSFVNEAKLLASFDHPSLVKVYRFWKANGTAYMVMPFLEGITLKDRLREMRAPPDEAWLRSLLGPVTEALAVIHAEQCYHRDIAPDNIMLLASNRWLLLDFGAARRVIGDMTQALTVILKPGYAPVEQYAEIPGMKQGAWTDVYALAAVVYFAIVGRTPPPSVGRLLNDTYVPLAQSAAGRYSAAFLAAIDRALIVRPEERTQTIEQLRAELGFGEVPAGDPYSTRPLPPGAVPARPDAVPAPAPHLPPGRRRIVGVAAGLAVLAVLGVGAYLWLASSAPEPVPAAALPAPTGNPAPAPVPVPPPALVAAAPAPASAALDVGAEFEAIVRAQTPGFGVSAVAAKPQLRIGRDELSFSVQSEREGFLYVLALGSDGVLTQLYPNTESGALKVRKGQSMKLPQPPIYFETTEPTGPGVLLVMVSQYQRDHATLEPRKEGPFRTFPTGADAARLAAASPTPVSAYAGRPICPASGSCTDAYGAALIKVENVR